MNGKKAKQLRRIAANATIGFKKVEYKPRTPTLFFTGQFVMKTVCTRKYYKDIKKRYLESLRG